MVEMLQSTAPVGSIDSMKDEMTIGPAANDRDKFPRVSRLIMIVLVAVASAILGFALLFVGIYYLAMSLS